MLTGGTERTGLMFITSFVHREELFRMTERWLYDQLQPEDAGRLSKILICDGFILGETLHDLSRLFLDALDLGPFETRRLRWKGELREAICRYLPGTNGRMKELFDLYSSNPDFFYIETPVNGFACLAADGRLLAILRVKRPRRIAEKANRYIANWIFDKVQDRARTMAEKRAEKLGIRLESLLTPEEDMAREFIVAEDNISRGFRDAAIPLDKAALTINDIGGIKIIIDEVQQERLTEFLDHHSSIRIVEKEEHRGAYHAKNFILEVLWDQEQVCRRYRENEAWKKYVNRGIEQEELEKGLEPWLENADATIRVEMILSTFPNMVESELGVSIHEERVVSQRDRKIYKGYVPMNVEFLIEYLFAVGLSPRIEIERLPVKLWGRYLPDSISYHIRQLYYMPEFDELY
jgi:hypothetical protein